METKNYVFAGRELTLREMQIISMMVKMQTRKVMAASLGISVNTLGHQITVLFAKTDCLSNLQLIIKALENGFDKQGTLKGETLI